MSCGEPVETEREVRSRLSLVSTAVWLVLIPHTAADKSHTDTDSKMTLLPTHYCLSDVNIIKHTNFVTNMGSSFNIQLRTDPWL